MPGTHASGTRSRAAKTTAATAQRRVSAFALSGVDGWRGIAAVAVILAHVWTNMDMNGDGMGPGTSLPWVMWIMQNLDIVIDMFFVLSAILIWLPFGAAMLSDKAPLPHGGVFFIRRVTRFLPLYWVVVVFQWSLHNYNVAKADWIDLIEHLTLTQSLDSKRIFYTVGPAWTMSVEWFFYLSMAFIAPFFVRWIRRNARTPGGRLGLFVLGTAPILLASLAFKAYVAAANIPVTDWAWRFGPAAKADIFIIGMWTGTLIVILRGRKLPVFMLPALLAVAVWSYAQVMVPPTVDHNLHHEIIRHTVASLAFCLMLFGLSTSRWQLPARMIDNKVMMPLSLMAYSIYILHEGIMGWAEKHGLFSYAQNGNAYAYNAVMVLALALPISWFFHRAIEMPWANVSWLVNSNGTKRELYPHLLATSAPHDARLLASYISHAKRRAGQHFGPSSNVTVLAQRFDTGPASPAPMTGTAPTPVGGVG
ncbi:acyltransferase [Nocardioides sp.]|uniref:acyltransferase family protein n=1 Tax=Nocardioides sp. TaxID=35761 RepID=UPI002623BD60|nr:acyltransferase [Nocardioides sp.]